MTPLSSSLILTVSRTVAHRCRAFGMTFEALRNLMATGDMLPDGISTSTASLLPRARSPRPFYPNVPTSCAYTRAVVLQPEGPWDGGHALRAVIGEAVAETARRTGDSATCWKSMRWARTPSSSDSGRASIAAPYRAKERTPSVTSGLRSVWTRRREWCRLRTSRAFIFTTLGCGVAAMRPGQRRKLEPESLG